jgi:hypothetical protein
MAAFELGGELVRAPSFAQLSGFDMPTICASS